MVDKKTIGRIGEDIAAEYYRKRGYRILARNFRCRAGEVDIFASKTRTLYVIEVKYRQSDAFGFPEEAVTPAKKKRMIVTAHRFLEEYGGLWKSIEVHVAAIELHTGKPVVTIFTSE